MNRLDSLPRGFGSFPVLEVLDLSYNSLNDESMPGNFWIIHSLRALYLRYINNIKSSHRKSLYYNRTANSRCNVKINSFFFSDNDFEYIPPEIKNMVNLRILALRDNELVEIPQVSHLLL